MTTAAGKVERMKQFLDANGDDPESLKDNVEFLKLRSDLEKSLADVVREAQPDFLDGWGVLVMHAAAASQSAARGTVITAGSVLNRNNS